MNLRNTSQVALATLLSLSWLGSAFAQETLLNESEATLLYEVELTEARAPITQLQEKLDQALEKLSQQMQAEGNLDGLLLIKKEREEMTSREVPAAESPSPEINKLREIYWRERDRLKAQVTKGEMAALDRYLENLNATLLQLTKDGKLEEALQLKEKMTELAEAAEESSAPEVSLSSEEIVLGTQENYKLEADVQLEEEGDLYILTSKARAKSYVSSKRVFETPFRIRAQAMTDKENIRFYFGQKGVVIFNWEVNPKQLRIHNPVTGENHGISDRGYLDPNEMYDIEIRVSKRDISVYVNNRKRGEIEGDFSAAQGEIGIGPAFGSRVTVASFVGIQE